MGIIEKKDDEERDLIGDVDVIELSDVPDEEDENPVELVEEESAEDIASTADESAVTESDQDADADADDDADAVDDADDDDDAADDEDADDADDAADRDGDDEADADEVSPDGISRITGPALEKPSRSTALIAAGVVVIAVVAAIVGYFVGAGGFSPEGYGVSAAAITEDELDTVVATYSYNGTSYTITAQEAIESEYSLEQSQNDDGTYDAPSASTILSYVRTRIQLIDAAARGIEVDDEEAAEYAEEMLGTSDYEEIADTYGVSEEQAEQIVVENATISKLYTQIVPEASELELPSQPTAPDDGDEDTASEEYAAYIIELLGDEWDADADTWASTDGDYYAALGSEEFTSESATYGQALTAYYVAYEQYVELVSAVNEQLTAYLETLYADAELTIYGLYY